MLPSLHFQRLQACLIAVLLVTAAIPATTVAASDAETLDTASDPDVRFAENIYNEQCGDVVEIGISLSDTDAATVRVASEETNYSAVVSLEDGDADGKVRLLWNTDDASYEAQNPDDEVTVREAANVSDPLAVGTYDLAAVVGSGTEANPTDRAALELEERSTRDLRTWVAPQSADLSNLSAVDAAKASGNLTRSDAVTKNDALVLELRASGLEGALAARSGSNATERFFDLLEEDAAELRVEQRNPSPELRTAEINLAEFDSTRVVADPANDSYYVVADLRKVNVTRGNRDAEIRRGHEYEANFSLAASSALTANGTESVLTNFTVVEPAAELATDGANREFVEPAPNRTLHGSTSLPPGSAVTVELESEDGARRFSETVRVRNGSNGVGEFAASFDFSGVPEGTNFTADVHAENYPELDFDATAIVVSEPSAAVEISTVESTGVSIDARLSHGGFVAVQRGSADGDLLGYSRYLDADSDETSYLSFDPDLESNASLVAVAYRDTDRDGEFDPEADEPYATEGSVVADEVAFAVEETTATATTTGATANPTDRETTDAPMPDGTTASPSPDAEGETTDAGAESEIPRFGVGAAVVALLALASLARRR